MKKLAILLLSLTTGTGYLCAQNVFPANGRVGIYTTQPAASLQVRGGARIGTLANYVNIDSATGNLSFAGTAGYKVADNTFAFSAVSSSAGLYFSADNVRYEFRSITGTPLVNISARNTGYVGIGIGSANATHPLQLSASSDIEPLYIKCAPSSGRSILYEPSGATSSWEQFTTAQGIIFCERNVACNRFVMANGGNVGIGTTSTPTARFEVGSPNTTTENNSIRVNSAYPSFQNGLEKIGFEIRIQDGFNSFRMYPTGEYLRFSQSADGFATAAKDVIRTNLLTFEPVPDNTLTLGSSSNRWKAVYAANGTIQTSDLRTKSNVSDLNYGLSAIMKMRPVSYEWKDAKMKVGTGINLGFVAQELEKVVPDAVVHTINQPDRETGAATKEKDSYGVKYAELIPVLTKALQEQQAIISKQQKQIDSILQKLTELQSAQPVAASEMSAGSSQKIVLENGATLRQNEPNPFRNTTVINYTLPRQVSDAQIVITDAKGSVVKQTKVTMSGSLTIAAGSLTAGSYKYSLIVDGRVTDTRTMVLTK